MVQRPKHTASPFTFRRWNEHVRAVGRYGWKQKLLLLAVLALLFAFLDMCFSNTVSTLDLPDDPHMMER